MTESTKILSDREQRAAFQKQLLDTYGHTLIVIRANYPGNNKHTPDTFYIVETMKQSILENTQILHQTSLTSLEGRIVYLISPEEPKQLKERMIELEERHPLGRLIDIDVMSQKGTLHRNDLNKGMRKCYLCDEIAQVCVRSQAHPLNELIRYYHETVMTFVRSSPREKFRYALLAELSCSPKFGLVTPFTSGSHHDMDVQTFIISIETLAPWIDEVVKLDVQDPSLFEKLRNLGILMEEAMFQATLGRNTHKGAIFLFLILITALRTDPDIDTLDQTIQRLVEPVRNDFSKKTDHLTSTIGIQWYQSHQITGIRGLVLEGMKPVLKVYLPYYIQTLKQTTDMNHAMVKTLLLIMSTLQDTTILKRGGLEGLAWYQTRTKRIIDLDEQAWQKASEECISRNLSGGGSADVLAVVIYLQLSLQKEGN